MRKADMTRENMSIDWKNPPKLPRGKGVAPQQQIQANPETRQQFKELRDEFDRLYGSDFVGMWRRFEAGELLDERDEAKIAQATKSVGHFSSRQWNLVLSPITLLRTICVSFFEFFVSHSQIMITFQPSFVISALTRASRATFDPNLAAQKADEGLDALGHAACRCQ
jgi:hypothetical protein